VVVLELVGLVHSKKKSMNSKDTAKYFVDFGSFGLPAMEDEQSWARGLYLQGNRELGLHLEMDLGIELKPVDETTKLDEGEKGMYSNDYYIEIVFWYFHFHWTCLK
jgi:hypothetical protein